MRLEFRGANVKAITTENMNCEAYFLRFMENDIAFSNIFIVDVREPVIVDVEFFYTFIRDVCKRRVFKESKFASVEASHLFLDVARIFKL